MRKIPMLVAIALIGLATLSGCSKSNSGGSLYYSMKATVGRSAFNTGNCFAVASGGNLVITGWSGGSATTSAPPQIFITILKWNGGTGTTNFDSTLATGYAEYLPSTATASESKTGTVTITSASSGTISGTFSFTGTDGTVVSNGSFIAKK